MFSEVLLDEELTEATFGYSPTSLTYGSRKKVVVVCTNCHKTVHREYRNRQAKHSCPTLNGSEKRCFKCKTWKDLSSFNKDSRGSGCVSKTCRECYKKFESVKLANQRRKIRSSTCFETGDMKYYIQRRVYAIISKCKRMNIECDIDTKCLMSKWLSQNGKCYYSGIPMAKKMKDNGFQCWDGPSIDRVDPEKGYTQDNIVWCAFGINSFKQSLNKDQFESIIGNVEWWFKTNINNRSNNEKTKADKERDA